MSYTDDLLKNNEEYAAGFDKGGLPLPPAKKVAVVACMDARLNPSYALGTSETNLPHSRFARKSGTQHKRGFLRMSSGAFPTRSV